jgi:hypothetical protein
MLIQGLWAHDSKLLQVVDSGIVHTLDHEYKIETINAFVNMDDEKRANVLKGRDV